MATPGGPIVLYDGVCALCNWVVRFTLARDRGRVFRFAALQSDLGRGFLSRHGRNVDALPSFFVVVDPGGPAESLLERSDGAVFVLKRLSGVWPAVGRVLDVLPRRLRDAGYDAIARRRYATFGKYDACPLPAPEHRARFL